MPVTFGYTVRDMVDFMADCRVQQIFAQFVGSSPNTFKPSSQALSQAFFKQTQTNVAEFSKFVQEKNLL